MTTKNLDTGMYIINKEYKILNCNDRMRKLYPEVKEGDICYKALAMNDTPCATCPLVNNEALFFNPVRKEWISANAAQMEYPGYGECYNVQFKVRKNMGGTKREIIRMEKLDEHLMELTAGGEDECIIGAYLESGSPLFFANENMWKLLGYNSLEEMEAGIDGFTINIVHPDDQARIKHEIEGIEAEGETFESIFRIPQKDGSWIWTVNRGKIIRTASGKLATLSVCSNMEGFLALHNELEEQREALLHKEIMTEDLLNKIPGAYHRCAADEGLTFLHISKSFEETVGWTKEEIRDNFDNKFIYMLCSDDIYVFTEQLYNIEERGNASSIYRLKQKDGGYRWVQDSTMLVEQDGERFYQCTLADITGFVKQQEQLAIHNMELTEKERQFEVIVNNIPSGFHRCAAKPGCPFIYIGEHFEEIVGFTKEEIEEKFDNLYTNLIWPEDVEAIKVYTEMLASAGKENIYDTSIYRVRHKDGGYRWVTDSTMFVGMGSESFFQGTIADITPYIEELEAERDRAEASSKAKSAFLFNASHDIRTPMNAIKGFAHIIEQNTDNPETVNNAVRKIQKASETLMTLMNDVLELSRIEQGKEEMNLEPVMFHDYGKNLYEMFAGEMEEAGITFIAEGEEQKDYVLCDNLKLTRIMMNLLSNAKKFTPAGGTVSFGAHKLRTDEDTATYEFFVKDTGIGMSREFQEKAFEQFERERTSTESRVNGSGLGLAITKKLVDLMGGDIRIESELSKGTQIFVTLTFPLVKKNEMPEQAEATEKMDLTGKRILLVEDNDFNREIAKFVLENMDMVVEEAENGSIAVDMVSKAPDYYYDLILMDIQMPVMDGYTASREIRQIPKEHIAKLPIIAMTANAFKEDRDKCLEYGMNEHISKPIDADVLMQTIASAMVEIQKPDIL